MIFNEVCKLLTLVLKIVQIYIYYIYKYIHIHICVVNILMLKYFVNVIENLFCVILIFIFVEVVSKSVKILSYLY